MGTERGPDLNYSPSGDTFPYIDLCPFWEWGRMGYLTFYSGFNEKYSLCHTQNRAFLVCPPPENYGARPPLEGGLCYPNFLPI